MKHILVVDDENALRLMVRAVLEDAGWRVHEAANAKAALDLLAGTEGRDIRVILLDVGMPGMSGLDLLPTLRKEYPAIPVVMLTAYGTVGSAVEAMKNGAFDYLTKPADNDELVTVAGKALEQASLLRENAMLREKIAGSDPLAALVGSGRAMRRMHEFIRQAAPSEATVLIMGESGTGKELIADALHALSPRAAHALVKVNCAALPPHLLESELFGYTKGAFTGAVKDKPGRFQLADKGTIFLDEIGELPPEVQAKLLRALQERVVEPLGSVKPVPVDVRIVAATNRDLAKAVSEGIFREDLYFRLNVLEVVAPPLRERLEDLPALVSALLRRLCTKNRKEIRGVNPAMLDALGRYHWPGNVRELENVLERGVILSRADILTPDILPEKILDSRAPEGVSPPTSTARSMETVMESAERDALVRALQAHGGHRERTAEALGISRRTLQYKLKKFGLTRDA
ncbi:sigma-54 dependent transcriptional regulator [Desulfovibrio sp. OttesenSCG-928-O18]|nr:sigma-54 dependent transcriptional regulator [Desulfovibrio sp. OttesenSCG-928-O18]